ncbi:MAG: putative metal-binding motif-containing protein [Alphaproteobacteria bacterium]|nr:putative metal-binding motif-containing protein [Alphaproteobacteria bacterium]
MTLSTLTRLGVLGVCACALPQGLPDTGYAPVETEDSCQLQTWHFDQDGDGFGVESAPVQACTRPTAHAARAGDCDDQDRFTYPGAPELCLDKVPNDCSSTPTQAWEQCPRGGPPTTRPHTR